MAKYSVFHYSLWRDNTAVILFFKYKIYDKIRLLQKELINKSSTTHSPVEAAV